MKFKIRKATIKDKEKLIEAIQIADNKTEEVVRTKVEKSFKKKDSFFFLAMNKKKIAGYVWFAVNDDEMGVEDFIDIKNYSSICWIAVLPEFRKKHLGSRLINEAEKYTKKYHKKGFWAGCRGEVIQFYEKNGLRNMGNFLRKTSSGKMKPYYVMVKDIKNNISKIEIEKIRLSELKLILDLYEKFDLEYFKRYNIKNFPPIKELRKEKEKIFKKEINSKKGIILAARKGQEYIGYIFAMKGLPQDKKINSKGYISDLFVIKEMRKKGISKKLMIECEKWFKKEKVNEIFIDVNLKNSEALGLYRKAKFKDYKLRMNKKLK